MSGVDNRIVTMQFNNRDFERNAHVSMTTLQKLKQSMDFGTIAHGSIRAIAGIGSALAKVGHSTPFAPMIKAAESGLAGLGGFIDKLGLKNPFASTVAGASEMQRAAQTAAGPQGMGALEGGVVAVSNKFIALTTIAVTALSNITNRAVNAGIAFGKSFTTAPIMAGLHEYETNLKAIQTVQANTDRPLTEINRSLDELNEYSDQTIYNFGEMAKNVGTFTAAGVDLETSVSAIKGIANMAALSGSNSQQAATAMYQLSQALASGKVGLMDWNSVVNAGMGGKKLQAALAQTAVAMGEIDQAQIKGTKSGEQLKIMGMSFRESLMAKPGEEAWLTSDILKNSLASLDGRFSVAALRQKEFADGTLVYKTRAEAVAQVEKARNQLAKEGVVYTDEQFEALQKLSTQAFESATKVKTLGQVFEIAKETIASGWSASFRNIFGNLKEAKKTFTEMSEGLGEILKGSARARNELLKKWNKLGGRDTLIDAMKNSWEAVLKILGPVKEGFRDIFPKQTATSLLDLTKRFEEFTQKLIPSKETMADIRDIAGGVFAVLGIGKTILLGVVDGFKALFGAVGGGNGDFLDFAAGIGRSVEAFHIFLRDSGVVTAFFEGLGQILSVPLSILKGLGEAIAGIFGGFDTAAAGKVGDAVQGVGDRLSGLQIIGDKIRNFFTGLGDLFSNIGKVIGRAMVEIGDVVAGAFTADTFGTTLDVINTTLLGGLVLLFKNFFSKGLSIDLTGGLFDGIKETLGSATAAFENMQAKLKADILLRIAAAIAVMAGALLVLSMIDPAALTKALGAMSAGFLVLIGAMVTMMKFMGPVGIVQLYVVSTAMTKMAVSILLLAFALKTMASINFGDMVRGLVGLGAALFIMTKALVPLAAGSKGMAKASFSLILIGVAMNLLAVALKILATMSWEEMAKGLIMLTGALAGIGLAMKLMPKGFVLQAAGILILSVAMNALGIALKIFATMSWEEMAKGLATLAGALVVIGLAMRLMPATMVITAAGLFVVANAMVVLAGALKIMASMGWEEIAKGMVVLAGSLIILAAGLQAIGIVGTIGAIGLAAATAAIAAFSPVMLAFGAMKWETIIKSLTMLAGIFVVLGLAGLILAPLVPVLLGLGLAFVLMGAGLALAGAGALAAATAFGIVVAAGAAGIQILLGLLASIIGAIPPALAAFGEGVVQFAVAIGEGAPRIAQAFGQILLNIINTVIRMTPRLGRMFLVMLNTALRVIVQAGPRIFNAGLQLILGFLRAIAAHTGDIVDSAVDIVVNFMTAIGNNSARMADSGAKMIIKFINAVSVAIDNNSAELGRAGGRLAVAIVSGMATGIAAGAGEIKDALVDIAKDALDSAKDFLGIGSPSKLFRDEVGASIPRGMALGVRDQTPLVVAEVGKMGKTAVGEMSRVMDGISNALYLDPNMSPTVSPVLDLTQLTQEASKMSSILATAPIMPTMSYQTAADISTQTQASAEEEDGTNGGGGGDGGTNLTLEQHLHSPKPIDSVEAYRAGKSLISLVKEAL